MSEPIQEATLIPDNPELDELRQRVTMLELALANHQGRTTYMGICVNSACEQNAHHPHWDAVYWRAIDLSKPGIHIPANW